VKQIVLSLALLPLLAMAGRAQQVLFTNFGLGFAHETNNAEAPSGLAGCPGGNAQTIAAQFQSSTSAFFQDAKLALALYSGAPPLSIYLTMDAGGFPGATIEGPITVSGLVAYPQSSVITVPSALHPFLKAGTSYWLVVAALNKGTCGLWFWNSTGDVSNGSDSADSSTAGPGGAWHHTSGSPRPAFQIDGPPTSTFQIRHFVNLAAADSDIDITNTGATTTFAQAQPPPNSQANINGSICVNIYAFAADEQQIACCSCLVTPNGLYSLSVKTVLQNSVLTSSAPNEIVVKLFSTIPTSSTDTSTGVITQTCNPATIGAAAGPGALASGLLAWGTTAHGFPTATGPNFQLTETPFVPATLSAAELTRNVQMCQYMQILGSGQFGLCKGCQNSGLGAAAE